MKACFCGDTAGCNIMNGVDEFHSMQAQFTKGPLTNFPRCEWRIAFTSRLRQHPIGNFRGAIDEIDRLKCESSEGAIVGSPRNGPTCARLVSPGFGPRTND